MPTHLKLLPAEVGGVDAYSRRLHKYLKQYGTVIQTASLIHREGFKTLVAGYPTDLSPDFCLTEKVGPPFNRLNSSENTLLRGVEFSNNS